MSPTDCDHAITSRYPTADAVPPSWRSSALTAHAAANEARSWAWIGLALLASALAIVPLMWHNRLFVDVSTRSFGGLVAAVILCWTTRLGTRSRQQRWQVRLHDFAGHALALILIGLFGAIGSYEAAADTTGFSDAALARSDSLLHFDWVALYRLVCRHPLLQRAGALAYGSIYVTPWVLLAWLAWRGETDRAHRFLLTFWAAAVLTLVLFPLFPARGALQFLWHGPIGYMPTSGLFQGEIIPALRAHAVPAIDLGAVQGIVCAPSFHTASAVTFMITAWPYPALRRLVIPVNIAMLLSTPVEGTHYLTDMLLGAMVAILASVTTGALLNKWQHPPRGRLYRFLTST